jgi:hypothetical protein
VYLTGKLILKLWRIDSEALPFLNSRADFLMTMHALSISQNYNGAQDFVAHSAGTATIAMVKESTTDSVPVATGLVHLRAGRFFTRLNSLC